MTWLLDPDSPLSLIRPTLRLLKSRILHWVDKVFRMKGRRYVKIILKDATLEWAHVVA
jgi:hypothetical protein